MNITIDKNQKRELKILAALESRTIDEIISELIDEYIIRKKNNIFNIQESFEMMKLSGSTFSEWDNEIDETYNDL